MKRLLTFVTVALLTACQQSADQDRPVVTAPADGRPAVMERSRPQANRDEFLAFLIARRIAETDAVGLRAVTVEVWGARAVLMGAVTLPEQRSYVIAIAQATPGVVDVYDELTLTEFQSLDRYRPDEALAKAVRRHLDLDSRNGTSVTVVQGVCYLIGASPDPEAAERLRAKAEEIPGIKWAVVHFERDIPSTNPSPPSSSSGEETP